MKKKDNIDKEEEDNEETISLGEHEGVMVKVGNLEKAPSKEEVAMRVLPGRQVPDEWD